MDDTTFDYLRPTEAQLARMHTLRSAAKMYAHTLETHLPDGPDKTYILRELRTVAMWVNVCLTRHADGSPRIGIDHDPEIVKEYPLNHPAPGDLGSVPT